MIDIRQVLQGTFIHAEDFQRVKAILSRCVDEIEMRDRLDKLRMNEPEIFTERPPQSSAKLDKREMAKRVLVGVQCAAGYRPYIASVLIHGTSEESMRASLERLKISDASWFAKKKK